MQTNSQDDQNYKSPSNFLKNENQQNLDTFNKESQDQFNYEQANPNIQIPEKESEKFKNQPDKQFDSPSLQKLETFEAYLKKMKKASPLEIISSYQTTYLNTKLPTKQQAEMEIKNYLPTEDITSYIKHITLQIYETVCGFMPVICSVEANPENTAKQIKVLKIYSA